MACQPRRIGCGCPTYSETAMQDFDWSRLPQEQLNEKFSRKFIHGEKIMVAQIFLKKGCLVPEHSHESEQMALVEISVWSSGEGCGDQPGDQHTLKRKACGGRPGRHAGL